MEELAIGYLTTGIIALAASGACAHRMSKKAFNPVVLLLDPFSFILGILLWPLWVSISVIEMFGFRVIEEDAAPAPQVEPLKNAKANDTAGLPGIGIQGRAETPLRPSGKVRVGSVIVDAIAENGFLMEGTNVTIIRHAPSAVIVRKADQPAVEQPPA
jgi:membrane-bound ClpP family serine protease